MKRLSKAFVKLFWENLPRNSLCLYIYDNVCLNGFDHTLPFFDRYFWAQDFTHVSRSEKRRTDFRFSGGG